METILKKLKPWHWVLIGIVLLAIIVKSAKQTTNSSITNTALSNDTASALKPSDKLILYWIDTLTVDAQAKLAKKLIAKCTKKTDEFNKSSWYFYAGIGHETWPSYTTIYEYMNVEGALFLVSNYFAEDWLFHESVIFLIDGDTYETKHVSRYSDDNKDEVVNGGIYEHITFDDENLLMKTLAENYQKPIKARFNGKKIYDKSLSAGERQALRDMYDLYWLKRIGAF